jgi:C4-dicarboxylate-binding protein DctP
VRNAVSKIEADAYAAAKENGMKVYTPTAAELTEWRKTAAPVLAQYKADAGALGAQLLAAAEEMRK